MLMVESSSAKTPGGNSRGCHPGQVENGDDRDHLSQQMGMTFSCIHGCEVGVKYSYGLQDSNDLLPVKE